MRRNACRSIDGMGMSSEVEGMRKGALTLANNGMRYERASKVWDGMHAME